MNKTRLENLSDGVFAIVFTILVLDIRIPDGLVHPSSQELWQAFVLLEPVFVAYFVSFIILTTFWVGHSFFFSDMVKVINRQLIGINMLYLAFVTLIPFSAYLVGLYSDAPFAVLVYGINILIIGVIAIARLEYAMFSYEIDTGHNLARHVAQARVRTYLMPLSTLLGIASISFWMPLAYFFFAFPIVFNIIPGLLNAMEKIFGFHLGE
jgi:uncharacterized membrane protein